MGVGRREAFGVRQLAAALSLCPNTVACPHTVIPCRGASLPRWYGPRRWRFDDRPRQPHFARQRS
ncbi:MAG: hypothetical protein GX456_13870 [Verrucomicrobia bacterium]|nr:hypothetical protein [Verrucomicrobiota bacterium]